MKRITREKFFHKLEGNEASKVLNNLDELKIMLPDNEHQHVICLKALRELQTAVCRSKLAPDYKDKLDNFEKEFNSLREQSDISISLKIHYILDHLSDLFELTGEGLGGVDDHVIECMHQYLNKRMRNSKYFVKDLSSELHGQKKLKLLLITRKTACLKWRPIFSYIYKYRIFFAVKLN